MDSSSWLVVGRLLRTRGRVGELLAQIDSQQPGRAERLHRVLLRKPKAEGSSERERIFEVERVWHHSGRPVFQFQGIGSISEAEPWEGSEILVPPEQAVEAEAGEFLHGDLVDCEVVSGDTVIGRVVGVEDLGDTPGLAPALLVETTEGREVVIPFAKALCPEVDLGARRIRVDLPDGLLDL